MNKIGTLACILLIAQLGAKAQFNRYIVQFSNKKGTAYSLSNPAAFLSQRAIERRIRQNIPIDSTDLPVSKDWLDSLRAIPGVTIINASKWLNQVCIQTTSADAVNTINAFPFVKRTSGIAPRIGQPADTINYKKLDPDIRPLPPSDSRINQVHGITSLEYGNMFDQIHIHEGEFLHNLGFTGRGIHIAVLDAGFQHYLSNPVFDSLRLQNRVLGEWDFVDNEASVNEDHSHGALVLSVIASNRPGMLVGSAPHASYWLLRTEDVASEYPIEEQYWAVAAEFADSAGADMISNSLGYDVFDNPAFNYSYAQRDGNTAMITIAADMAAKKGMLVVSSAGNSGGANNDRKFVGVPADGDSVFTVGGIDVNGNIYASSSWGPNGANRQKPNAVSVGAGTVIANTNGAAATGSGTSYSCPNLAGLMACLWQAFPEFTNMEIFEAVQQSADRYTSPDPRFGYGIPNFRKAYEQLAAIREIRKKDSLLANSWMKAYPVPARNDGFRLIFKAPASGQATLRLINVVGQVLETRKLDVSVGQMYFVNYRRALTRGVYYIRYEDGTNKHTLPIMR
jgi:Subtilisin-like serine proteases